MDETSIVLVGVGGYGALYVKGILDEPKRENVRIVGVVDPYAQQSAHYERIVAEGIPIYDTLEAFYAQGHADLAVVSSPIPFHADQSIYAMEHGSHVMLEKPIAATVQEAQRITDARDKTGKILAIGYQLCYDPAMQRLKADVDAGVLGKPIDMRAIIMWARGHAYYARGIGWAGKKYDAQGRPIFDHILSNATAHYLLNMLWLAGNGYRGTSIADMEIETARANDIETFDTAVLRAKTESGANLHVTVSHAIAPEENVDLVFTYTFACAIVHFDSSSSHLTARFSDGSTKDYGAIDSGPIDKMWQTIDVIRSGGEVRCPAELAIAHTAAMDRIWVCSPEVFVFPKERTVEDGKMVRVPGLAALLHACHDQGKLPGELGKDWMLAPAQKK